MILRIVLPVAAAFVAPPSWFPFVAGFVAGVLVTLVVLIHLPAPEPAVPAEPVARRGLPGSVGEAGRWRVPPPLDDATVDVLLYGPPGDVFIQGHGREPVAPVGGEWQHALDARGDDPPAHARSVAAQRRWDAPSPATQPTEAVAS